MLYIYSHTLVRVLSMVNDPKRSDMNYISDGGASEEGAGGGLGGAGACRSSNRRTDGSAQSI